jgi:hypothetical protein
MELQVDKKDTAMFFSCDISMVVSAVVLASFQKGVFLTQDFLVLFVFHKSGDGQYYRRAIVWII